MDDNGNLIIDEDGDNQPSEREIEKRSPESVKIKEEVTTSSEAKQVISESNSNLSENNSEKSSPMAKKDFSKNSGVLKRPSRSMANVDWKRMRYSDDFLDQDLTSVLVCNIPKYYNEDKIGEFFKKSCELLRNEIFSIKIFQNIRKDFIGSVLLQLFNSTLCKKVLKVINGTHIDGKLLHATLDTGGHLEAIFNINKNLAQKCSQYSFNSDDETEEVPRNSNNLAVDNGVQSDEKTIYGFTEEFFNKIGVKEPFSDIIIVENIPMEATDDKLSFAFALAGFVQHIDRKDGTATIEYSNPLEAIQAVSMFNGQKYYENVLKVTMDTQSTKKSMIPEGFTAIGPGLGKLGKPLPNVATYLLTDSEQNKRDNGESDILNRIQNTLSKVKSVEREYGIHPKRIINFLNDMLLEHVDSNSLQNRDPRIAASRSQSGQPVPVQKSRNIPVQVTRLTTFPQNSGYNSPGGSYRGPNMEPSQINNFNMLHSNKSHPNNMGPHMAPVITHGPVQHMGNQGPFQPQGPAVGQFQPQGPAVGQFQPQGPHTGHFHPQGQQHVVQMQPQGPPAAQFQQKGPSVSQFQSHGPPGGQFQPQGPPASQFQQQGPPAAQFQSHGPPGGQFQPQGPAVNAAPPVYVTDNSHLRGSPQGNGNRGPDGDVDNKDMVVFENLPVSVTTDVLLEKAQKCGHVKFLHLTSTGVAFVRYYNRESAERCLSMFANSKVDGHIVHVRFF